MTEHDALLRAICENPCDDLPRLVYADWLEENGQSERAAFIRTQIEMARLDEWDARRVRYEQQLDPQAPYRQPWASEVFSGLPGPFCWCGTPLVRRGFPWCLRIEYPNELFARDGELFPWNPIEQIHFARRPPDLRHLSVAVWLGRLTGLAFSAGPYAARHLVPFLSTPALAIEELSFEGAITRDGVAAVFSAPLFPRLLAVRITGGSGQVGREVLEALGEIPTPNRLRTLDLTAGLPGNDGIPMLAARRIPPGVRSLTLSRNHVNGDRAAILAGSPALANLRVLNLAANPLGNAGAAALAASPHLSNLLVLDLGYCQVGDDGIRAILESPLAERLVLLNLNRSPASDEMKQALKDRMGDRVRV